MTLLEICERALAAKAEVSNLSTNKKNEILSRSAALLVENASIIMEANKIDVQHGIEKGMKPGLVDRLTLDEDRIKGIAEGIRQVVSLNDPIGEITSMKLRPNGLKIGARKVPLGVIGMIYEARPNVTADAFALCHKTGNVVILKGGSDAIESNKAIVKVIHMALSECGVTEDAVLLIEDTSREVTKEFMTMRDYIDVLIPRGGAGLIRTVVENSKIPVIETGTGNCHVFVDESADLEMAVNIIENAKTQRIGVCNACESLLIHEKVADKVMPMIADRLFKHNVEIRADKNLSEKSLSSERIVDATEADWGTEYLDYIISAKTVGSIDEAIAHINKYNTGHSESIITNDYNNAEKFLNEVDAACVYVNASTRFTDGFEFGFGAEIGISTQKLHARGPMGLDALCSNKYVIYGNGQIR